MVDEKSVETLAKAFNPVPETIEDPQAFVVEAAQPLVATSLTLAVVSGYPEHFANDSGSMVNVHYATEFQRGAQHLTGYTIHDALDHRVVRTVMLSVGEYPVQYHPCTTWQPPGCDYPGSLRLETASLEDGVYYVVLCDASGEASDPIYFLMRPPPSAQDRPAVAVMFPTYTYWAYSQIGGGSLYYPANETRRFVVSTHRPISGNGPHHSPESMIYFVRHLRSMGVPFYTLSNSDLALHPEYLSSARLLLIGPHDEYWTHEELDAVRDFLAAGGRVAVLGGNVAWWQVAIDDDAIYVNKSHFDDRRHFRYGTGNTFMPWIDRPPEEMFGLSYSFASYPVRRKVAPEEAGTWGLSEDAYAATDGIVIADAGHPIFEGTGLQDGSLYGADLKVMDVECDGLILDANGAVDYAACPRAPRNLRVLARAKTFNPHARRTDPTQTPVGVGDVAIIAETHHDGGGVVLHFGSVGWYHSVATDDPQGVRIFENTIRYLLGDSAQAGAAG